MDKLLDNRFERVEKALASLIDSISKYSPSSNQANELAASDKELSNSLSQLQTHQNNHARIQKLRQETADLDAQIKSTISVLWTTRKEITATPTTTFPPKEPKYQFTYTELLNYARRISRNTLPPPGVTNGVDLTAPPPTATTTAAPGSQNGDGGNTADATSTAHTPIGTTASASAGATPVATAASASGPANGAEVTISQPDVSQVTTAPSLPDHLLSVVNMFEGAVFYPWPGEDRIRGGALALNQQLRDVGVDPRGHDPEEEERRAADAAEQERKEVEERQRLQKEEHERRSREERERIARERARARERENEDAWRRGSSAAGPTKPPVGGPASAATAPGEKKQFQFMGDLDDDDD